MMKLIRSLITRRPVCFSMALCSVVLVIAGWLIFVLIKIANDVRGYVMGLENSRAQGRLHRNVIFGVVLLAINVCGTVIYVLGFTYWSIKLMRREMCLHAGLIKQKEATEEAERKSMSKSVAVANASHEVRTALAGITGLIQMCRAEVAPRSTLDENLKHIESCTNDLYSLLNSILDASKIEAGKMQVEEAEFDLQELLEDVVDLYYPVGMKKGVDVILDPCDGSVENFRHVRGDRGKLKQVLSNLLYNSIKFTDEGYVSLRVWGRKPSNHNHGDIQLGGAAASTKDGGASSITILRGCASRVLFWNAARGKATTKACGQGGGGRLVNCNSNNSQKNDDVMEYIFDVVDTGKGIPKEKRKSVFENYVQVKETDANNEQLGHGLGLGIVKSLVRLMGGEIGIVDEEIGERGTCFRFNVFLESCSSLKQDIESQCGSDGRRHCRYPPKVGGQPSSQVVLFIQCEERSKIAKRFLESRGIKVSVVKKGYQQLSRTLKKIKQKLFPHSNSGGTSPSYYYSSSSSSSSSRSEEVPLSALDGTKDPVMPFRTNSRGIWNNKHMVLIIIDTSAGPFPEVSRAVAEFQEDLQLGCVRVLWIDKLGTHNEDNKDKLHLPSTDLVMSKPLQGSRLHHVLGLLPEFASTSQHSEEIQIVIDKEEGRKEEDIKKEEKEEDKGGPSTSSGATQNKPLAGKRILIVEDNPMLRRICSVMVSQMGALSYTSYNGEEAFQLVSKALHNQHQPPFDYILMDCEMPIMDGFEATRRIQEEGKAMGIRIPIIALTAHTEKEEIDKITEAGMDYYLAKPLKAANLLTAIHYLDKSSAK